MNPFRLRHAFLAFLSVATMVSGWAQSASSVETEIPPNVVFIYTDDQADWSVGCYGLNRQTRTPNIDKLAAGGARFARAYASAPVCSAARAALMTSRFSSETGIRDFIPAVGHKAFTPETGDIGLAREYVTFPEILRDHGYRTGLVGKWHLGDWTVDPLRVFHPERHGYEYFMGLTGGGVATVDPELEEDGEVRRFTGLTDDILTDRAIRFIDQNQAKPFLLSIHLRSPHGKWLPVAESDWASFEGVKMELPDPDYPGLDVPRVERMMREYLASVAGVDRNVGEILAALEERGLRETTIVIFSSDHGFNMGHNGIYHKGNGLWVVKPLPPATSNIAAGSMPNLYERSLLVPAIVSWPGVVQPGTVIEVPISDVDWYPTVVEMVGLRVPTGTLIRGRSLVPLLDRRAGNPFERDEVYAEYDMQVYSRADMRSLKVGPWKMVQDFLNPWRSQLYNLHDDPGETSNLIGRRDLKTMSAAMRLSDRLLVRMEQHDDYLLQRVGHSGRKPMR